ncbi:MAG TPA: ABC transporter ATP-binding protein [Acidimicrobiales bacterium]|nr:ABC transporter ATP-binding protein [Acidimicrobiales bacterium]
MRPGGPMMIMHSMGDPGGVRDTKLKPGTARRVLAYTTRYRGMLAGFVVVIVCASVLQLLPALLFRRMIDHAIPSGDRSELNLLAALILAGAFCEAVLSLFERWWSARIGEGLIYDLRVALFDHVQRMPISFFTRTQTGALVSRMNNDVIGAQRAVTGTLGSVVSNTITLTTVLITLFILQWQLTLLALVLLPVFLLPARRVGARLQTITRESMNHNAAMNTQMTERFNVAGALLVKLFGRPKSELDEFSGRADLVRAIGVRSAMYSRVVVIALTLVGAVGTAAIYWIGGQLAISGSLTTGTLAAMGILVARIYMPLTSLTNARIDVMSALVSFERVFEVLDAPNTISDKPDAISLDDVKGAIEFDRVHFRYPRADETSVPSLELDTVQNHTGETVEVLHDVTLSIAPGRLVALVGPSGAGKTTLASLVPRLYDVTGGAVRIDGHDVRDLTQSSVHGAIGVVSQDPHLFHDTVMANLRYARPDATFDEVQAACRAAQIHEVITALPDGYGTVVGERGYRLSGGEKQRLAIARMLVKDPAIVVLDEATSHLDSENEALVQRALANALADRTAIVIAHRLSTITNADQIVVIDDGRVVERGRHDELRAAGGLYADLYNTLVRDNGTHDAIDSIDVPVA